MLFLACHWPLPKQELLKKEFHSTSKGSCCPACRPLPFLLSPISPLDVSLYFYFSLINLGTLRSWLGIRRSFFQSLRSMSSMVDLMLGINWQCRNSWFSPQGLLPLRRPWRWARRFTIISRMSSRSSLDWMRLPLGMKEALPQTFSTTRTVNYLQFIIPSLSSRTINMNLNFTIFRLYYCSSQSYHRGNCQGRVQWENWDWDGCGRFGILQVSWET